MGWCCQVKISITKISKFNKYQNNKQHNFQYQWSKSNDEKAPWSYLSQCEIYTLSKLTSGKIGFFTSRMKIYLPYPCIETVMVIYEINTSTSNTSIYQPSPGYYSRTIYQPKADHNAWNPCIQSYSQAAISGPLCQPQERLLYTKFTSSFVMPLYSV